MSAFVVDDKTIEKIINVAIMCADDQGVWFYHRANSGEVTSGYITRNNAAWAAQVLLDENYRSVNARYSDAALPHPVQFRHQFRFIGDKVREIAGAFKAADCLDYQSCETDDWESTLAYKILQGCRSAMWHALPGYKEAQWR